ncbi:MAG: hypothetical protein M1818_008482 [Claussenomyces sp. TS43310]|nr:MAG: hypothetical protein M1818_008482 [Claussenomyces sp. TS43310]
MAPVPEEGEVDIDDSLQNVLTDLKNAARIPAKQRNIKISAHVDKFCTKAYERGLPPDLLEILVDIITLPNEVDQASTNAIIRNMYPAGKVTDDCVIKVVGSLGHGQGKPYLSAQAALLKWLIMVYDVLENPKVFSSLYSVLFNLLDTIAIRLELARRAGNDPSLVGLIRVYKDYYPDVIVGETTAGRASVFTHPNREWRERLIDIQKENAQRSQNDVSPQHAFRVVRRGINGVKRSRVSAVPEVHTSHAQEASIILLSSVTLEEIETVDNFIGKLEKIELPNQLVAVFGDPLLQKLLQLKSNDTTLSRIDNWLEAFFEDQLADSSQSESPILDMLTAIRDYTRFSKMLPPVCLKYLQSMLPVWNGVTGQDVILELVASVPISPFEELYSNLFQLVELALLDNTPESQIQLLKMYTSLLRHWTRDLLSITPSPGPPPFTSSTMSALITHTNLLALTILETSPSISGHDPILTFYEMAASLFSHSTLQPYVRITAPLSPLVYILFFSSSLSSLSRLCGILALYKRAFEVAMGHKPQPSNPNTPTAGESPPSPAIAPEPYPKEYVNHFNGFLMDICNCLWRGRAFNMSDVNALGCLLPAPVLPPLASYVSGLDTRLALATLFSLSYSPLLCNLSISYLRQLEDEAQEKSIESGGRGLRTRHAGPVTQRSLVQLGKEGGLKLTWAEYRLGVLRYLEDKGVKGVGELMYNTMKHLMGARESGPK